MCGSQRGRRRQPAGLTLRDERSVIEGQGEEQIEFKARLR